MQCPKCGFDQIDNMLECQRCGVIFSKVREHSSAENVEISADELMDVDRTLAYESGHSEGEFIRKRVSSGGQGMSLLILKVVLFEIKPNAGVMSLVGRLLLWLMLLVYSFQFIFSAIASNTAGGSIIHLVNLPFHEAGHILFYPMGSFMASLGGSLFQLMVPLICCGVLLVQTRDTFGASVCFWWFGENFLDLAPYINDARAGVLPLIGGNTGRTSPYGFHDWEFILTESGLIRFDQVIAKMAHLFGSLFMIIAIIWAGYLLYLYGMQLKNADKGIV